MYIKTWDSMYIKVSEGFDLVLYACCLSSCGGQWRCGEPGWWSPTAVHINMCFIRVNKITPEAPLTGITNGSNHFPNNRNDPSFEIKEGISPARSHRSHRLCAISAHLTCRTWLLLSIKNGIRYLYLGS